MKFWKDPSAKSKPVNVFANARGGVPARGSSAVTVGSEAWRLGKERANMAADSGTMLAEDDGKMDVAVTSSGSQWEYCSYNSDGSMQLLPCLLEKISVPNNSCSISLDSRGRAIDVFAITYSVMRLTDRMVTMGVTLLPPGKKWLYLALKCWDTDCPLTDVSLDEISDSSLDDRIFELSEHMIL
jgi:hypothetical protein